MWSFHLYVHEFFFSCLQLFICCLLLLLLLMVKRPYNSSSALPLFLKNRFQRSLKDQLIRSFLFIYKQIYISKRTSNNNYTLWSVILTNSFGWITMAFSDHVRIFRAMGKGIMLVSDFIEEVAN